MSQQIMRNLKYSNKRCKIMKQTLKEEEIIELIKEYLKNSNTDNAILIDGEWGSGKTFFVKNKIIKDLTGLEKEYQGKEKKILL